MTDDLKEIFGQNLQRLRRLKNISMVELSEMIIDEQTNQKRSSVLEALENRIEKLS